MPKKFSVLGLPFSPSMRCRLLLGLFASAARPSNPIVALIRSRSMRLAGRGVAGEVDVQRLGEERLAEPGVALRARHDRFLEVSRQCHPLLLHYL